MNFFTVRTLLSGCLVAGTALAGFAAETVYELKEATQLTGTAVETKPDGVFMAKGKFNLLSRDTFSVDTNASYVISGEFRAPENADKVKFYFGFSPQTADGKRITPMNCNVIAGAVLTELSTEAKKGDTVLKIKNNSGWKADNSSYLVVFGAKSDLSDLPNFNTSPYILPDGISKLSDGTAEIKLAQPLRSTIPADTAVRLHASDSMYIYSAAIRKPLTGEWQNFSGKVSGLTPSGINRHKWRPGTAQSGIVLVNTDAEGTVEFRNIKVEKE